MKLFQKELPILLASILLIIAGLVFNNSYLAMAICAILGIVAFINPKIGLMLLIITIPLRTFFTALNPGYKLIGDLIVFALLFRTFYNARKDIKSLFKFQFFEIAFFAFLGLGTISALITDVSPVAIIFQIRAYILFYILYYVVKRMNFEKVFIKQLALTTFISGIFIALHGFIEKISDRTVLVPFEWTQWGLDSTNHVRVYGLLKGPNELALYLLITFLISLYLLRTATKQQAFVIYAGLSIIGATFLLTYSRGAFLAFGVFLVFYVLVYRSFKGFIPLLITAVVSGLLFTGVSYAADLYVNKLAQEAAGQEEVVEDSKTTHVGKDRFTEAFSESTVDLSATDGRIYFVNKAIEVFKDYPVIGAGFGTFGGAATLAYSSPIYKDYEIQTDFYSDNQYILTLAETGILGVLILVLFVIGLLQITIRLTKLKEYAISITLLFFLVAMMVGGLVYNILEIDSFMMYYFLVLGYAYQREQQLQLK